MFLYSQANSDEWQLYSVEMKAQIPTLMEVMTWEISCIWYIWTGRHNCRKAAHVVQRQELVNYLLDSQKQQNNLADSQCIISETYKLQTVIDEPFIEIRIGDLYFCQEQRLVCIGEQVIELTAKEFDILALLIAHPKRVFTYELIMELVWNEDYSLYSRKAVNNQVSNLRRKLRTTPDSPDYIKSVIGVGYKFEVLW